MQKKVTRKEVDIVINPENKATKGDGKNTSSISPISESYRMPSPLSLAAKYGVESPDNSPKKIEDDSISKSNDVSNHIKDYEMALSIMKDKLNEKNKKIENLCVLLEALEPTPGLDPVKLQLATQLQGTPDAEQVISHHYSINVDLH